MTNLLSVRGLRTYFPTPSGLVRAVDGVDLTVKPEARVGIVGESGSGKSVLMLSVMRLIASPPAIMSADRLEFEGRDLTTLPPDQMRQLRGDRLAMIFQDPMTSLNPFLTIGDQIAEPLIVHRQMSAKEARDRVLQVLLEVGIRDAKSRIDAYPHQFSGGMRQRVMIAMAMTCNPSLLIADEPTTALDVTIQAQILDLMNRLRENHKAAVVLITHDMGVAAGFCDEIHVMYAGRVIERASTDDIFASPRHPYTEALLESVPRLDDPARGQFTPIPGEPPDMTRLSSGCPFHPRCRYAIPICRTETPPLVDIGGRAKACHVDITVAEKHQ